MSHISEQEYCRSFFEEMLHCFNGIDNDIKTMQMRFGYEYGGMTTAKSRYDFSKNIWDEVNELESAIDEGNIVGIRDAVCDILVFSHSLLHHMGDSLIFGQRLQEWIDVGFSKTLDLELVDETINNLKSNALYVQDYARQNLKREIPPIISNICYECYVLSEIYEFDITDDMQKVIDSNLTKFCKDEDALQMTIDKYASIGIEVYYKGEFPDVLVYSSKEQNDVTGKVYRANKFLKSVDFEEPDFG